jgi:hypothetical protein
LGANLFYTQDHHNTQINYLHNNDTTRTRFTDAFGVKKRVFGMNCLLGIEGRIDKRIMLDVYAGFGIRMINFSTVGKEYDTNNDYENTRGGFGIDISSIQRERDANASSLFLPNLTFGIRLCYNLW